MRCVTYKCEVISPMFLHGYDRKELQFSSVAFKSSMRFWWRALQQDDGEKLLKKEEELFGGIKNISDKNLKIGRSPFDISVKISDENQDDSMGKAYLLPHKNKAEVLAFKEKSKFEVILSIRGNRSKEILEEYMNLFELVSLLGGIGQRSRRGAGSYAILQRKIDDKEEQDPFKEKTLVENIMVRIESIGNLKMNKVSSNSIQRNFKWQDDDPLCKLLCIDIKKILPQKKISGKEVFKKVSYITHEMRDKKKIAQEIAVDEKMIEKYTKAALGKVEGKARLASPVLMTVSQIHGNEMYVVSVTLTCRGESDSGDLLENSIIRNIQKLFVNKVFKNI